MATPEFDGSTGAGDGAISRRGLFGAAAGTAGLAALISGAPSALASPLGAAAAKRANALDFFSDQGLNYSALTVLGASAYNAAQVGEVLTVFNSVHARGDTYAAYGQEFERMAARLAKQGTAALRAGHRPSARDFMLRAAEYYAQAIFYVLAVKGAGRPQEARLYRAMEACFATAARLFEPAFQHVEIPYEKTTLPGWILTPPGKRMRRPTVIFNNGSDAQNIDLFVEGAYAATERGWNALIFEGPGQGASLFLRGMPFRPDWEAVVTPIVDWVRARDDVDRRRVMLTGVSFGGYLVPRAAAFEHRLAAVAVDPGVTNAFRSWSSSLPKSMLELLAAGQKSEFNKVWAEVLPHLSASERFEVAKRTEIYGNVSFYDQMKLAEQFVLTEPIVQKITAPVLVTEAQDETFYPGMSMTLMGWLRNNPKHLVHFTVAEGAQYHCEVMAPTLRNDTILDWLQDNLRPTG